MVKMIPVSIPVCVCFLAVTFVSFVRGQEAHNEYRFVVGWDAWNETTGLESVKIRINGISIGNPRVASKWLEGLPVAKGEHVKIEMPRPQQNGRMRPPYYVSSFLQKWTAKGAFVDLYEDGKKLNSHLVSWKNWFSDDGEYVKSRDDLTWIVDGKEIGKGLEFVKIIKRWEKERDVVVQVVDPIGVELPVTIEDGIAFGRLWELWGKRKITMFFIAPETERW